MTGADWVRVIDEAADCGVPVVQFIGGEPTLHPALSELINHALSRGLVVEVFTNLVHVPDKLWDAFAQPGVSLATSYYSDDADQHATVTGRPSYARTRANITEAVRRGIPLRAGVIDFGDGQRAQHAIDELAVLGVQKVGYDRLRQVGRGAHDRRQPSAAQLCGQCGDAVAAISTDGSVWPCVFSRWLPIGDVRRQPLREIFSGLPAARTRLAAQGMPVPAGTAVGASRCNPGDDCWPYNCHPRWAAAGLGAVVRPGKHLHRRRRHTPSPDPGVITNGIR